MVCDWCCHGISYCAFLHVSQTTVRLQPQTKLNLAQDGTLRFCFDSVEQLFAGWSVGMGSKLLLGKDDQRVCTSFCRSLLIVLQKNHIGSLYSMMYALLVLGFLGLVSNCNTLNNSRKYRQSISHLQMSIESRMISFHFRICETSTLPNSQRTTLYSIYLLFMTSSSLKTEI